MKCKNCGKEMELKNNHLRLMNPKEIKRKVIDEGFEVSRTTKNYVRDVYIIGLKLKIIPIIPIIQENEIDATHRESVEKNGIIGIIGIKSKSQREKETNTQNTPKNKVRNKNKENEETNQEQEVDFPND